MRKLRPLGSVRGVSGNRYSYRDNKRRKLVIALGASVLAFPLTPRAQAQPKVWRIGSLSSRSGIGSVEEAFRHGLRELGYIEGQNLAIEWRFTKGNVDLLPELATELVRLKVDCIVTNGANATRAAKQATDAIPIVMQSANGDPVRNGLVASLARPGANVTGFISIGTELAGKQLELLGETLPKSSRFAILWDPNSLPAASHFKETGIAARALGCSCSLWKCGTPRIWRLHSWQQPKDAHRRSSWWAPAYRTVTRRGS